MVALSLFLDLAITAEVEEVVVGRSSIDRLGTTCFADIDCFFAFLA